MDAKPFLTHEEENKLVEFLIHFAKMVYGKTRKEVVNLQVQKDGGRNSVKGG